MIYEVQPNELQDCLEVIHQSFRTVADQFGLTKENCPKHTSFTTLLCCRNTDTMALIKVSIIEESTVWKNWYIENGFVYTGTKKFDHLPFTSGYLEWKGE